MKVKRGIQSRLCDILFRRFGFCAPFPFWCHQGPKLLWVLFPFCSRSPCPTTLLCFPDAEVGSLVASSSSHCHFPPAPPPQSVDRNTVGTLLLLQVSRMTHLLSVGIKSLRDSLHGQGNEETAVEVSQAHGFWCTRFHSPFPDHLSWFLILFF